MWRWFENIQIQSKMVAGQEWFNLQQLCDKLNYMPQTYRIIFQRLPCHMKQKLSIELPGNRNVNRCCINRHGVELILFSLSDTRKKNKTDEQFLKEQNYKKKCIKC